MFAEAIKRQDLPRGCAAAEALALQRGLATIECRSGELVVAEMHRVDQLRTPTDQILGLGLVWGRLD